MNYWHMQLHQDDDTDTQDKIYKILETEYIGLGDWEKGHNQIAQFKNSMQKGDIVLIRHKGAVALVSIVGEYQHELSPDTDWFEHRRKIKILSKYDTKFKLPKKLGSAYYPTTLQSCSKFTGDINNEKYTIGDYIQEWHKLIIKEEVKMKIKEKTKLLEYQKQIILQGPPGTGKTRVAKQIAISMIDSSSKIETNDDIKNSFAKINKNQIKLIQFHPSYSYEDFVRGIIATTTADGKSVKYETQNKVLGQMAEEANKEINKDKKYILIIDEINRANLSSVLGELIYALEYRDEAVESMYELEGSRKIILPSNLYIIGTMNTADRSIGHIDYAIRRRFTFVDVLSNENNILSKFPKGKKLYDETIKLFTNDYISPEFNIEDIKIGHSYFIAKDAEELKNKLEYQVKPLLREYIKDGVLNENAREKVEELKFESDS